MKKKMEEMEKEINRNDNILKNANETLEKIKTEIENKEKAKSDYNKKIEDCKAYLSELEQKASSQSADYEDSLIKMIKEAADEIGGDDLIIQLNEADTNQFKGEISPDNTFDVEGIKFKLGEPINAIGGAILKTSNGDIEVNNTIDARLERFRSILRS